MSKYDKIEKVTDALPGIVDLVTLGACGIMALAEVIKYDKCEIFIKNNHQHDIYIALDDCRKKKIRGWYKIEAYTTRKIYKTERNTYSVGIYGECSECSAYWGNGYAKEIPNDGNSFKIKYDDSTFNYNYNDNYKEVKFSYSSDISQRKEYTFGID